jgi:hypothetical protein
MSTTDALIAETIRRINELHYELENGLRIPNEVEIDIAIETRFLNELLYDNRFYNA